MIEWEGSFYFSRGYIKGTVRYVVRYTQSSYRVWVYDVNGAYGKLFDMSFELAKDAKQWCEMHWATGAGDD